MGKKGFRPAPAGGPHYPRLGEVNRRVWRDWGLIAAGSLLLGSGCRWNAGRPVGQRADADAPTLTSPPHAGVTMPIRDAGAPGPDVKPPPLPDAGVDERQTPPHYPGVPPRDHLRGNDGSASGLDQRAHDRRVAGGLTRQHAADMRAQTRKKPAKDK